MSLVHFKTFVVFFFVLATCQYYSFFLAFNGFIKIPNLGISCCQSCNITVVFVVCKYTGLLVRFYGLIDKFNLLLIDQQPSLPVIGFRCLLVIASWDHRVFLAALYLYMANIFTHPQVSSMQEENINLGSR